MSIPYPIVESINFDINRNTWYKSDIELYGAVEFWEIANGEGDCEDYALAKRKILRELGYIDDVHMAICLTEYNEVHAVLIVNTDDGEYVLDNCHKFPMKKSDLPFYRWKSIENGGKWFELS